jgi:deoxycytidine triphosphate deaminase
MQSKQSILELLDTEAIVITSTNKDYPFIKERQVGSDSIDLRLGEYFYIMSPNYTYVNTLNLQDDFCQKFFVKKILNSDGYILQPHEIIFMSTLERINMKTPRFYGYISGRSLYSRLGLSVHCTMTKFGYGMDSIVSLQLINNSPVPLKIFPRQKMVQVEIHEMYGETTPYDGRYSMETEYLLPKTQSSELESYMENEKRLIQSDQHAVLPKAIHDPKLIERLDVYFKIKKVIGSVLGIGGFVGFFIWYAEKRDLGALGLTLISLLITIDYIYSIIALSKGVNINE